MKPLMSVSESISASIQRVWRRRVAAVGAVTVLVTLCLWQLLPWSGAVSKSVIVPLSTVTREIVNLSHNGLGGNVAITLFRFAVSLIAGGLVGMITGSLIGASRWTNFLLHPVLAAFYSLPVIALYPIILIIVGPNELAFIIMIAIGPFFAMNVSVINALHGIDARYVEVAIAYEASRWQLYRMVILPHAVPLIFAGVRIAIARALVGTIGVEFSIIGEKYGHYPSAIFPYQQYWVEQPQIFACLGVSSLQAM